MTKQQEIIMIIVNKRRNVLNKKKRTHMLFAKWTQREKDDNCQDDIPKMQERERDK